MKHLSTRVRIIIILSVLLAAGLGVLSSASGQSVPDMIMQAVMAPIKGAANALTKQAEQYYSYMFRYEALAAENEVLEARIAEMEDVARRADSVSRENERLRQALDLLATHEDYKLVESYIIAWGSNDWTNTITINRGENAGIEVGMCAITANGELVGQVTEVGSNFAVVKTILDSSLGISATIASSGYNGMVQGNYISGDEDLLRMNYLPTSAVIRNKDTVVTSGSTSYPRDLVLGYVIDAGFADTGVAKYALLQPAVDIDTLELVFILTEYNAG